MCRLDAAAFRLDPSFEVVEGDITDTALMLSYASDFESAMSSNVFEHIADDRAAMEAVYRVLRHGGLFVCFRPCLSIDLRCHGSGDR